MRQETQNHDGFGKDFQTFQKISSEANLRNRLDRDTLVSLSKQRHGEGGDPLVSDFLREIGKNPKGCFC